ncbi:MAG TPA: Flp pilus assembly protein CpaB, partial [Dialister sp.]|nr:Flp pilus assembly protein CpaB [Dialister sp.]
MKLADKLAKAAGKMSPRKLILLCAFFALMIFIILYSTLSSFEGKKEEKTPEVAGVAVIEAAMDISPRTVITDDMLKASVVPESLLPPGALTDKKLIVGHKAGVTILAGDVITRRKLDVSAAAGFQGLIPDGMRALSFGINDISGVSGFAKPGDHVDILLISSQDGKNRVTSKMLLRDVLLLAINKSSMGQGYVAPKKDDKDGKDESNGNKMPTAPRRTDTSSMGTPAVATVALSPYDAAKLTASLQVGQVQLMLRPADGADETESVAYYVIPLP